MRHPQTLRKGFSLLELLLSVTLLAMLSTISIPIYRGIMTGNELQVARQVVTRGLRSAQLQAMEGKYDSSWGVYVQPELVTVFSGTSYATRTVGYDLDFEVSRQLVFSGDSEVLFEKGTGLPDAAKTITLTETGHDPLTITINTLGAVSY